MQRLLIIVETSTYIVVLSNYKQAIKSLVFQVVAKTSGFKTLNCYATGSSSSY